MINKYYDKDCNMGLIKNRTIAIIGYGSQGHAHANNLKESGMNVVVGLRKDSSSWKIAEDAGLKVMTTAEAAAAGDMIMMLVPDETCAAIYKQDVEPNLKEGNVLMFAHEYGEKFQLLTDPAEGVKDADVVVTAAWNTAPGTPESERRLRDFAGFQITSPLMSKARSDALLLHCLPAHRGEEISTAVFEEHADEIFTEAENRLHVQKAVLAVLLANQ